MMHHLSEMFSFLQTEAILFWKKSQLAMEFMCAGECGQFKENMELGLIWSLKSSRLTQ